MYPKSHLAVVGKHLEPLVSSRSVVLPVATRPYHQHQQAYSSLPIVQLWPATTTTSTKHQQQQQQPTSKTVIGSAITTKRALHSTSTLEEDYSEHSCENITCIPTSAILQWTPSTLSSSIPSIPLLPIPQQLPALSTLQSLPVHDSFAAEQKPKKPDYVFAHGASGFAKCRRINKRRPYHPPKQHFYSEQMGEDAFFRRGDSFGISDGVSGWAGSKAADPAFFARHLMHHAYLELERYDNIDDPCFYHYDDVDPVQILQKSYEASLLAAEKEGIVGSCTACLAVLRHDELRIANLGDCGISVIRHNDIVFRSEEQQHSFNFPYQLGTGSPDQPKDAQVFNVKVEKNDIIIMGSDGLYDNLFDKEILAIIQAQIAPYMVPGGVNTILQFEPQRLSDALAQRAKTVSDNRRNVDSPFQSRALHEGFYYRGGKADDISCVVAVVRDSENSRDRRL